MERGTLKAPAPFGSTPQPSIVGSVLKRLRLAASRNISCEGIPTLLLVRRMCAPRLSALVDSGRELLSHLADILQCDLRGRVRKFDPHPDAIGHHLRPPRARFNG